MKDDLALIIENKATNEVKFGGVPNVRNIFELYIRRFKKSIQKGYDQCWRVKRKFLGNEKIEISNKKGNVVDTIDSKSYHNVFSIILTLDEFRTPQINTSDLLKLEQGDDNYPLSISIDDFEVILLTLKKMNKGIKKFVKYLQLREQMQGKLRSNEELSIWATFLMVSDFSIPRESEKKFTPGPKALEVFTHQYERGIGFRDEKYMDLKKKDHFRFLNALRTR